MECNAGHDCTISCKYGCGCIYVYDEEGCYCFCSDGNGDPSTVLHALELKSTVNCVMSGLPVERAFARLSALTKIKIHGSPPRDGMTLSLAMAQVSVAEVLQAVFRQCGLAAVEIRCEPVEERESRR